ncbi:MAG: hypothetical protein AAF367_15985 [Pseudomonadota bacterium]
MTRALGLLLCLAGCGGQGFTSPPANPPVAETPVADERLILEQDQRTIRVEQNPYARRPSRRADYDVNATLIAENVALVAEPAEGAPIYVSNLLGAALARRFAGQLPLNEAMGAAEVFLIKPVVSGETAATDGIVVVDWLIRSERGEQVGAVFASRRLTGAIGNASFWDAFTVDDAEFIAIQTAAQIAGVQSIRDALANAAVISAVDAIPAPLARPEAAPAAPTGGWQNLTTKLPGPSGHP